MSEKKSQRNYFSSLFFKFKKDKLSRELVSYTPFVQYLSNNSTYLSWKTRVLTTLKCSWLG